jgi:hypothetical protein
MGTPPVSKIKPITGSSAAPHTSSPPSISDTKSFYIDDFGKTLFPLKTNKELIIFGENEIKDHIKKCLDETDPSHTFLSQRKVYAAKAGAHLRRTVKLDAVSEYFIYDIIYRNKNTFRKPHSGNRVHYGYRIEGGAPIPASAAYKGFRGAISAHSATYKYFMSFDVASYFNSIYHHDLVSWFAELDVTPEDTEGFGQILREMNSGRSLDCLPQGLYPTKMIGNDFLRFIDNFNGIKSEKLVRFMDDIYVFSNREQNIMDDFQIIQRLLGDKGLSVNPQKTQRNSALHVHMQRNIDEIKKQLLEKRRFLMMEGYDEAGNPVYKEHTYKFPLTKKEIDYIDTILKQEHIEEEDAELILTIMRDHTSLVEKRLPDIMSSFPNLAKSVYSFCSSVKNKEIISDILLSIISADKQLMEFQLFWLGAMLEDYLMNNENTSQIISGLYNHRSATPITKAKVLEICDARFGLQDLRDEHLLSGQSDWLGWSSAIGSRSLKKISRNHKLKYFSHSSSFNKMVASIVDKM